MIKDGLKDFKEFVEESWAETGVKGKISVAVGMIAGILLGAFSIHSNLAEQGCQISTGIGSHIANGLFSLVVLICVLLFGGILIRGVLELPTWLTDFFSQEERTRRKDHREMYGSSFDYGYTKRVSLTVLVVPTVVSALSVGLGYLGWVIFC